MTPTQRARPHAAKHKTTLGTRRYRCVVSLDTTALAAHGTRPCSHTAPHRCSRCCCCRPTAMPTRPRKRCLIQTQIRVTDRWREADLKPPTPAIYGSSIPVVTGGLARHILNATFTKRPRAGFCLGQRSKRTGGVDSDCSLSSWVSRKRAGGAWMAAAVGDCARPAGGVGILSGAFQASTAAKWCLWSFIRLCVAVIRRHSERAADLPRLWNWLMRRLCLV